MTKMEFLATLSAKLESLSEEERKRVMDYYSEMIDDRVEDGMSEADAVSALGDPEELARDILPGSSRAKEKDDPVIVYGNSDSKPVIVIDNASQEQSDSVQITIGESVQVERNTRSVRAIMRESIRSVVIDGKELDFSIQTGALPDGVTAMLECGDKELPLLDTAIENGVLTIRRNQERNPHSFMSVMIRFMPKPCTLILRDRHLQQMNIETDTGNQSLTGLEIEGTLTMTTRAGDLELRGLRAQSSVIKTSNGDLHMDTAQFESSCEVQSAGGDISLEKTSAQGTLKIQTRIGDVELDTVHADELKLQTLSGDITAATVSAQSAEFKATSGDIELSYIQTSGALFAQTINGDIEAHQINASGAALLSTSGDVNLWDSEVQISLTLQAVSGDIAAKQLQANQVSVQSTSGDIRLTNVTKRADLASFLSSLLKVSSHSGDITLSGVLFDRLELSSTSGDIHGQLEGQDQDYDFRASSRSGDVRVPVTRGPRIVEARTVSGDISIRAK